jgi:Tfp pilus assembly protein PilF
MRRLWPIVLALWTAPCSAQVPDDLDALINAGGLDEAAAVARAQGEGGRVALADILVLQGRLDSATALYTAVRVSNGVWARPATAALAELAMRRGDAAAAAAIGMPLVEGWRAGGTAWPAEDQLAAARILALLGAGDPALVREALRAFDAATRADPALVEGRLGAADLLLEHYNAPDAKSDYQRVLDQHPGNVRALVGLASVAAFEGNRVALERTREALAVNPRSVPALLLLARLHLESEQYDSSGAASAAALAADSSQVAVWAAAGALAWVTDDTMGFTRATDRALALNPRAAGYFAAVAEAAARHRRYADAAEIAARGVALDPQSVPALVAMGTNQLRIHQIAEGRATLERAFALDPFHLWTKNTLDLLDQLATFDSVVTPRFEIVAPAGDIALLGQLLGPLLEEAYDSLVVRYDYRPPTPIRLELFDRHADFSVRTIGLAGLGALGVSFGTTLVMDAPTARRPGEFNVGSTAWHELAHTFTLGRSAHRVPRWFSEGLSVLEERRARPGWGARANILFVQALAADDLLPLARLNDGFVRPDRPERIGLSYYQASLVCEFLEQQVGIAGIRAMLDGYARGLDTETLVAQVTGASSEAFDAAFDAWLAERFAAPLAAIAGGTESVVGEQLVAADGLMQRGDTAAAIRVLTAARDRFPEYGGSEGPRLPLALALHAVGRGDEALQEVGVVTANDETALLANRLEAEWRVSAGDTAGAIAALRRTTWIAPGDVDAWRRISSWAGALARSGDEVAARRAVLALDPGDPVAARTDLAEALLRAGDATGARRELLTVLERAPSYERAQGLLLRARAAGRNQ